MAIPLFPSNPFTYVINGALQNLEFHGNTMTLFCKHDYSFSYDSDITHKESIAIIKLCTFIIQRQPAFKPIKESCSPRKGTLSKCGAKLLHEQAPIHTRCCIYIPFAFFASICCYLTLLLLVIWRKG